MNPSKNRFMFSILIYQNLFFKHESFFLDKGFCCSCFLAYTYTYIPMYIRNCISLISYYVHECMNVFRTGPCPLKYEYLKAEKVIP